MDNINTYGHEPFEARKGWFNPVINELLLLCCKRNRSAVLTASIVC